MVVLSDKMQHVLKRNQLSVIQGLTFQRVVTYAKCKQIHLKTNDMVNFPHVSQMSPNNIQKSTQHFFHKSLKLTSLSPQSQIPHQKSTELCRGSRGATLQGSRRDVPQLERQKRAEDKKLT